MSDPPREAGPHDAASPDADSPGVEMTSGTRAPDGRPEEYDLAPAAGAPPIHAGAAESGAPAGPVTTGAYPPVPAVPEHKCPTCDYLLTGLTARRCPECGEPFDLPEAARAALGIVDGATQADRVAIQVDRSYLHMGIFLMAAGFFGPVITYYMRNGGGASARTLMHALVVFFMPSAIVWTYLYVMNGWALSGYIFALGVSAALIGGLAMALM